MTPIQSEPATISITVRIIPSHKQFFALLGSSSFITKYAMTPPIMPINIGRRYHRPDLFLFSLK